MQSITEKLDRLAEFHAQRDVLSMDKQSLIDQVLTPEIKARLVEIEAEFSEKAEAVNANIATLEAEIKADILAHGESVKGQHFQAVWSKGRVSWDDKGLSGYAKAHPELLEFRKQGEPSVSIRRVAGS
jgi:hypothetical protein